MSNFLIYSNRLRQSVSSLSPEQAEVFINDAWRDIREANDQWSFLWAEQEWIAPAGITLTGLVLTQWSPIIGLTHDAMSLIGGLNHPGITERQLRFGLSGGPIYEIASSDVQQVSDAAITSATNILTSVSGPFSPSDVGKLIIVPGAGTGGLNPLQTSILGYTSPTQVTLAANASTTVSNALITWGSSIVLKRDFAESSLPNATALLYRVYYSPLTTDFHHVDHLLDRITGYEFGFIIHHIDDLDRIDPLRASVREPYQLFFHHYDDTTKLPVYEMWPGPTVQRSYKVSYWRIGLPFVNDTDSLPPTLTEELLLLRAKYLAYEWGEANDPDARRRQSYGNLMMKAKSKYSTEGQPGRPLGLLDQAMRRDEEIALHQGRVRPRRPGPGWPQDSKFQQSHAIPVWWGGMPS